MQIWNTATSSFVEWTSKKFRYLIPLLVLLIVISFCLNYGLNWQNQQATLEQAAFYNSVPDASVDVNAFYESASTTNFILMILSFIVAIITGLISLFVSAKYVIQALKNSGLKPIEITKKSFIQLIKFEIMLLITALLSLKKRIFQAVLVLTIISYALITFVLIPLVTLEDSSINLLYYASSILFLICGTAYLIILIYNFIRLAPAVPAFLINKNQKIMVCLDQVWNKTKDKALNIFLTEIVIIILSVIALFIISYAIILAVNADTALSMTIYQSIYSLITLPIMAVFSVKIFTDSNIKQKAATKKAKKK